MGIQTGVYEIDQKLRGLHLGMMGVISARSSGGKSTLATQIMSNVASKLDRKVLDGIIDEIADAEQSSPCAARL